MAFFGFDFSASVFFLTGFTGLPSKVPPRSKNTLKEKSYKSCKSCQNPDIKSKNTNPIPFHTNNSPASISAQFTFDSDPNQCNFTSEGAKKIEDGRPKFSTNAKSRKIKWQSPRSSELPSSVFGLPSPNHIISKTIKK